MFQTLAILTILILIGPALAESPPEIQYVSGLQQVRLASADAPVLYNSYSVLLIREELPDFSFQAFDLPNDCRPTDHAKCNFHNKNSTITKFMFDVAVNDSFSPELGSWKEYEMGFQQAPDPDQPEGFLGSDCDQIRHDYKDLELLRVNLTEYTEELGRCSLSEDPYRLLESRHQAPDKGVYRVIGSHFSSYFAAGFSSNSNQYYAMGVLGQAQAFPYFLIHQQLESQRWKDALARCRDNKIPPQFLTPAQLQEQLTSMNFKIAKSGFKLAIPEDDLVTYYKLPLADCVFTKDGSLVTRVQVPIQELSFQHECLTLKQIPFLRTEKGKLEICSLPHFGDRTFVVGQNFLVESKCKAKELCLVPRNHMYQPQVTDPCLSAIFSNGSESEQDACPLNCVAAPTDLPIFHPVLPDTILMIGGDPGAKLFMQCSTASRTTVHDFVTPTQIGSLKIRLPCSCQLVLRGKEIFRASRPCNSEARAAATTIIRPYISRKNGGQEPGNESGDSKEMKETKTGTPFEPMLIIMLGLNIGTIVTLGWVLCKLSKVHRQGPSRTLTERDVRLTTRDSGVGRAEGNTYDEILFETN